MTNQTNPSDKNGRKPVSFNPLAWGILFFSFWISLQTIDKLSPLQERIGWLFLVLSAVLFCSIFISRLHNFLIRPGLIGFFIPLIFFISLMGFTITLVQSWPNLEGAFRYIAVIGGVLWLIAYLLVLMRIVAELGRVGFWLGIVICIALIGKGIYDAFTSDVGAGIMLVALGIISIVIVIKKPSIWHKWPFV